MASIKKIPAKNKQGYKWRCVMEGPPDPVTGERRQIPRVRDTKQEAIDAAQEAVNALNSGLNLKRAKQTTFSDGAHEWLADYSRTKVKSSSIRLRTKTLKVLEKHISKINIDQVTHRQYKKILNALFDEGYSKSYLKSIHICANMIFEWAILNNLRDDNPCKGAKIPQRVQTVEEIENSSITEKFLEKNEIQEFLAEVRKRGLYGDLEAFHLLIYSGLRPGELCALKWSDLNFSTGMLRITKTLYSPESNMYKIEITPPKTDAAVRTFDLDDVIMDLLKAYKIDQEERQKRYKKVNDDFSDEHYMFSRPNGRPLNQKFLLERMNRLLKRTTITKHATPYIFRHTHISMLAEARVDLAVIMQRIGHDDSKTTLKIYTHVTAAMTADATEKVKINFDNIINPKKSPEM